MEPDELRSYLDEPMRMAQVAATSPRGLPLLGSLWFQFSDTRFWFSSHPSSPLVHAAARGDQIAVIVDDFTPPERIRQVRIRGVGTIEDQDTSRVRRIYQRYLGDDVDAWPDFFRTRASDPSWTLWSVPPQSGVATVNPNFRPREVRWSTSHDSPFA